METLPNQRYKTFRVHSEDDNAILNNYTSDYKNRLLELNILQLAMQFEFNDVLFYFKAIKSRVCPST